MKTSDMHVTSQGLGMHDALAVTETLGAESGLDRKEILHLRLLSEELFGLLRGIAGNVDAVYWLDIENRHFLLHMKSDVKLTKEMRTQLLSVSSSGTNAAAKGFMGKIRELISDIILPSEAGPSELAMSLMNAACSSPAGSPIGESPVEWSMGKYRDAVRSHMDDSSEAPEAWDELEKSIVANIADEVSIHIAGSRVEITIDKTF